RVDFETRKDWASLQTGGAVDSFDGPDLTPFGCGPEGAIDLSQGRIWGSTTGDDDGTPTNTMTPKHLVVKLARPVDIGTGSGGDSAFKVDPTAGCGDAGSASTGDFTIEVSPNGTTWTTVVDVNGEANWLGRFQYTNVAASQAVAGVQYVRLTLNSPQVPDFATNCPDGAFAGCQFTDFTELEVFGSTTP
ncbi:MAG TPA: discoidin domain-containing protein, partial [Nocardioidaceae bacterium]